MVEHAWSTMAHDLKTVSAYRLSNPHPQPPGTTEQSFNQSCQDKDCGADVEYWSAWSAWSQCGPRETDCLR